MSKQINHIYEFGDFQLQTAERLLLLQGRPISLTPKAFETLLVLIERSGHVVEKDELMKRVWADSYVEEANLARNVWSLRKALGDDKDEHLYIETIPKLGYRFLLPVTELPDEAGVLIKRSFRARIVSEEETSEAPLQTVSKTLSLPPRRFLDSKAAKSLLVVTTLALALTITGILIHKARSRSTVAPVESVAVLPFTNVNNDPELDYLSDGLTENLINRLSHVSRLKVIAHNSVFRYKGRQPDPQKVGSDLGVQAVLVGRLEARGGELTISTELVDTRDGTHLWGDHYQRKIDDLQSLQGELAQDMATALRLQFSREENARLIQASTSNPEAYQFYLKGRYYWNKRTREGEHKGLEAFAQAIRLEPDYALAYVGLADCYSGLTQLGALSPNEAMPKARAAALKALRIDDTLPEAHASMAMIDELYDWDFKDAEIEFKRAIELNPNYATGHHWYAMYLSAMGKHDEALVEIRKAESLDPVSLITNTNEGWILFSERQYDQAIQKLRTTIEMDPNFANAHYKLALVYEVKGMYKEAVEENLRSETLSGTNAEAVEKLRVAYKTLGWKGYCQEELQQLKNSSADYVSPRDVTLAYLQLGDKEQSFKWLEEAYKERTEPILYLRVDPRLDILRSDPRFEGLLRRVNLAS